MAKRITPLDILEEAYDETENLNTTLTKFLQVRDHISSHIGKLIETRNIRRADVFCKRLQEYTLVNRYNYVYCAKRLVKDGKNLALLGTSLDLRNDFVQVDTNTIIWNFSRDISQDCQQLVQGGLKLKKFDYGAFLKKYEPLAVEAEEIISQCREACITSGGMDTQGLYHIWVKSDNGNIIVKSNKHHTFHMLRLNSTQRPYLTTHEMDINEARKEVKRIITSIPRIIQKSFSLAQK